MKRVLTVVLLMAFSMSAVAAPQASSSDTPTPKKKTKKSSAAKPAAATAEQLSEIKAALATQQQQIQSLQQQVQSRDQTIQSLQQRLDQNQMAAQDAAAKADSAATTASRLQGDVADLKGNATSAALSLQETQKSVKEASEHPTSIHFKGITITPGGFIEAATVNRSRGEASGINSDFKGIPFVGADVAHISDMQFSARQSRLSLLAEGKVGDVKYSGYYEMDFLGTGVTSNQRQSNSYVFRQRQLFARVDLPSHWAFTAGQQWSLATENVKGIVNRNERFPLQIDPQYVVGFTWQRAYALRVVKTWDKVALGISAEGSQTTLGGRGFNSVTSCLTTQAVPTTTACSTGLVPATSAVIGATNFWVNAPGDGAGLFNFVDTTGYTPNKLPDFVAKAAFDPGGNWGHYEIFGILSEFRNRIYPCGVVNTAAPCTLDATITKPSSAFATTDSRTGGGLGASAFWTLFEKKVDFGVKAVAGDGIGRFGTAQLADATVRPDGTLAPIRTVHYLTSLVFHPNKKVDIYGYWGQEFAARAPYDYYQQLINATTIGTPPLVTTQLATTATQHGGYGNPASNNSGCFLEPAPTLPGTGSIGTVGNGQPGNPGSCAGDPRVVGEATLGFWHKVYQGDRGRFQWGIQYSYVYKIAWSGTGGGVPSPYAPKAVDNMVWTSFRYYLP